MQVLGLPDCLAAGWTPRRRASFLGPSAPAPAAVLRRRHQVLRRLLPLVLVMHVVICTGLQGETININTNPNRIQRYDVPGPIKEDASEAPGGSEPAAAAHRVCQAAWPVGQSHLGRYKLTGQLHASEAPVVSIELCWTGKERSRTWRPLQPNDTLATSVWSGVDASGRAAAIKIAGHNLHGDDSCARQPRVRLGRGRGGSAEIHNGSELLDGLCLGRLQRLLATRREMELLRSLRHPHIARLISADMHVGEAGNNNKVAYATELAHGSLATLIAELHRRYTYTYQSCDHGTTSRTVPVPEAVIRALLQQIGSALVYLADAQLSFDSGPRPPNHGPYCQWRLKPANVLLAWDWRRSLWYPPPTSQPPRAEHHDHDHDHDHDQPGEPELQPEVAPRFLLTGLDTVVPSSAFTGQAWAWKDWNLRPKELLDCLRGTCWPHGPARFLPSIVLRGVQPEPPYSDQTKPWRTGRVLEQRADGVTVPAEYLRELGAMAFALMTAGRPLPLFNGTADETIDLQQPDVYFPAACRRPGFAAAIAAALPRVYSAPLRIVVQRLLECSDSSVPGQQRLAQHHERRMTLTEAFAVLEVELVTGQHPHTPDAAELDLTCSVHTDCSACTGARRCEWWHHEGEVSEHGSGSAHETATAGSTGVLKARGVCRLMHRTRLELQSTGASESDAGPPGLHQCRQPTTEPGQCQLAAATPLRPGSVESAGDHDAVDAAVSSAGGQLQLEPQPESQTGSLRTNDSETGKVTMRVDSQADAALMPHAVPAVTRQHLRDSEGTAAGSRTDTGSKDASTLAAAPRLSDLANAALRAALHNRTGTEAVAALEAWLAGNASASASARTGSLAAHVTVLDFSGMALQPLETARVLKIVSEGCFPSVTRLDLAGNALAGRLPVSQTTKLSVSQSQAEARSQTESANFKTNTSATMTGSDSELGSDLDECECEAPVQCHGPACQQHEQCVSLGRPLTRALAALPRLQHLSLSRTAIGRAGAAIIIAAVAALPASAHLRHLNVSHSSIGSEGIAALGALFAQAEGRLGHLEELDVSGSHVLQKPSEDAAEPPGGVGVRSSFAALAAGLSPGRAPLLRVLRARSMCSPRPRLDSEWYWQHGCYDDACRMSACHDGLAGLLHNISTSIGTSMRGTASGAITSPDAGTQAGSDSKADEVRLQQVPQTHQQLKLGELDVGGNQLPASHSARLLSGLSRDTIAGALRVLRWDGNGLDNRQARDALADALQAMPGLQVLDLSSTGLGDTGTVLMAHALLATSRGQLQELRLRSAGVGLRGMAELEPALAMHPAMAHLDLAGNSLGSEGAAAVARAMAGFPLLERLVLSDTHAGLDGLQALTAALQHVPGLRYLSLKSADGDLPPSAAQEHALASRLLFVPRLEHLHWYALAGLARALPHLQWLRSLFLNGWWCNICDLSSLIAAERAFPDKHCLICTVFTAACQPD